MKSFKKLFAIVATAAMLSSIIPTAAFAAGFSADLQDAYDYASKIGITTQPTIEAADMYGSLIRSHMAKMMVNYAKKMGKTADTSVQVNFSDIAAQSTELQGFIIEAAQMGIMGVNPDGSVATKFNPAGVVTRAQFGTVLSRVLYGDMYDGATPYYADHLAALKNADIMTKIENPMATEVRGYVMLMMMRASDEVTPEKCLQADIIFACTLGTTDCPAECKDAVETPEVKAGNLNVSVSDYSSSVKSAPAVGTIIFNAVKFSSSESVTVNTVTLERLGLSSRSDIKGVWFENNGVSVSSKGTVATDGTVSVVFNRGLTVKSSENVDLVVELSGAAGSEIAFKMIDVKSTAKSVSIDALTNTYRTANYSVGSLKYEALTGSDITYKLGDQTYYEFGRFSLENTSAGSDDKDILVKAISLKNTNSDVNQILSEVEILRDGKSVASTVKFEGSIMTISLTDTISAGKKATYVINSKIGSLADGKEEVKFYLNKNTDIVSYETSTNFRSTVVEGVDNFRKYTVEGGKIVLTSDGSFASTVEAGQGYSDVLIANGTLTIAEPVKFDKLSLVASATGIKSMVLEIAGSRYPANINTAGTGFDFEDIYVSKTSSVKLLVSLNTNAVNGSNITIKSIQGTSFVGNIEYQNNQSTATASSSIAGAINVAKVAVKEPKFSIKNNNSTTVSLVKNTSRTVTIFDGLLSSSNGIINVSDLTLNGTIGTTGTDRISLTLYVDGSAKSTVLYQTGSIAFNSIGNVALAGKTIRIDALPTMTNTGDFEFNVSAKGTDAQGNSASTNSVKTAKLSITAKGSASISTTAQGNKVALDGSNAQLATFDVYVQDGSVSMDAIAFSGSGLPTTWTLEVDGSSYDGVSNVASGLVITGMNKTLDVGSHTFKVVSSINTTSLTGEVVTLNDVNLYIDGALPVSKVITSKYYFVKSFPILALKNKITNEITVSITNTSTKPMTITSFDAVGAGITTTGGVYINEQERGTVLSPEQKITINPGQSIDVGLKAISVGTVKFNGLVYTVNDSGKEYTYTVGNTYTNFPWGTFQVTYTN